MPLGTAVDRYPAGYPDPPGPIDGPGLHCENVVPADDVWLAFCSRYVFIGGTGNIRLVLKDDPDSAGRTYPVVAGQVLFLRATQIRATLTTATGIKIWD